MPRLTLQTTKLESSRHHTGWRLITKARSASLLSKRKSRPALKNEKVLYFYSRGETVMIAIRAVHRLMTSLHDRKCSMRDRGCTCIIAISRPRSRPDIVEAKPSAVYCDSVIWTCLDLLTVVT